jgi:hypothetical protein
MEQRKEMEQKKQLEEHTACATEDVSQRGQILCHIEYKVLC